MTEVADGGGHTLLIVHHTPSPALQTLLEATIAGTRADGLTGITVSVRAALAATAIDVLTADGFIIGTSANIGYLSGAVKHFFDQVYYPCLTAKVGAPYGLYVHGGNDTGGAIRAAESITSGMGWQRVCRPVSVVGTPTRADTDAAFELGATVAASLLS
jgi:NAD(P)H-dependent FMN reductase